MKSVMAIGAHPDDIEFGCSGTLLKHKRAGDFVVYVCMTHTESNDGVNEKVIRSEEDLVSETAKSTKILGVDDMRFLPFKDLEVPFSFDSVCALEKLISNYNVDTIYTHWAGDSNQDHIATFKTTMAAARYVKNVYCYEQIPILRLSENPMQVNYYVDITDHMQKKLSASIAHESQIKKYTLKGFNVEENLITLAMYRGIQAGCKYAEAFTVIKHVA